MLIGKNIKLFFLVFVGFLFFSIQFFPVFAYDFELHSGLGDTGYEAGYDDVNLTEDNIPQLIGRIIRQVMLYLGVFFLALTIYAGFIWMIARGNEQEIEKAKTILKNAIIGLIVVLLAYAITYLFMDALSGVQADPETLD